MKMLERPAQEEGTYSVKFTFKDELGVLVTPSSLKWWLTDLGGTVINNRSDVDVALVTNPYYLVLTGDDLQMTEIVDDFDYRVLTLKGTYDSELGNNLPLVHAVMFKLSNLLVIAQPLYVTVSDRIMAWENVGEDVI